MHIEKKQVRLKYDKILKIMYGIILIFFVLMFVILVEKTWDTGKYGQFAALVIGEIFIIYGGLLLNRLWKRHKDGNDINDEEELEISIERLDGDEQWKEAYKSISDSKRKISYIRHDIANHVQVIQAMQEQGECDLKSEKLEEIRVELDRLSTVKYCDNILFDIALEQRIRIMQSRGLKVQADIQLTGMESVDSEQLCLIFWLLIDGVAANMSAGQNICIKLYRHSNTDAGMMLAWSIEGECESMDKQNTKVLEFLLNRMNGSIMVDESAGKVLETGMMEVKYADGR